MGFPKNALTIIGTILAVLGVLGLVIPVVTTQRTTDVAKIGDLKLQTTERTSYDIPPLAAGGTLAVGLILIGVGFRRR